MKQYLLVFLFGMFAVSAFAISYKVKTADEYLKAQRKAAKGDSVVWMNGVYVDIQLELEKNGIVFCAADPGSVIFTGSSWFKLKADSVAFSGFQFKDGQVKDDILKVSGSYNVLENLNFSNYHSHYYLNVTPEAQHNLISRCNFERKPEDVPSSVVEIQVSEDHPGYHVLRYCSFKNHTAPPNAGGDFGIEALRIGYSFQSKFISRTLVEYCYFTKCNGDGEIISSKARENVYRYNTFENNGDSHFTLRHGKDNVVYGNFFVGGAGLRIREGQNQMVYNNYFDTGGRFAIWLVNHESDPLENVIIAHNTFVHSGILKLGGKGNFPPGNVLVANNIFYKPVSNPVAEPTEKEKSSGNIIESSANFVLPDGFDAVSIDLLKNEQGLFQPGSNRSILHSTGNISLNILNIPVLDDDPDIDLDIMQQQRADKMKTAGCFIGGAGQKLLFYATEENTGPDYLHY